MGTKRRTISGQLKSRVALEAIKGTKTLSELAREYSVHPNQIVMWKKRVLEELPGLFSRKRDRDSRTRDERESELYRQIGQLKVELDWLKKKVGPLG